MLGLAVGDALGAAVEWLHPDQIHARYGGPLRDLVASAMWERGEWTDDTAMALELATSLADQGGYDEDDVFSRYAMWARSGPKDIGSTVAAALHAGAHGRRGPRGGGRVPPAQRRQERRQRLADAHRADRASATATDPGAVERISRLDSSLTHHDPLAGDACAWLNLTLAALSRPARCRTRPHGRAGGAGGDGRARPSCSRPRRRSRWATC